MPVPALAAVGGLLGSIFTKQAMGWIVRFLVVKLLIKVVFLTLIPMVLIFVWFRMKLYILNFMSEKVVPIIVDYMPTGDVFFEVTGVAAYLGQKLRLVEVFSILISGLVLTFAISAIKR
jgi:hypothetical protein